MTNLAVGIRDPVGRTHWISHVPELMTILCSGMTQTVGQWIAFPAPGGGRILAGVHNGRLMERVGEALVFVSDLDEAGEDYAAFLCSGGLTLVRVQLNTSKLTLESHYRYVCHLDGLRGPLGAGPDRVSGEASASGREMDATEAGYRVLRRSASVFRAAEQLRYEISRHDRGAAGLAGVDARITLESWKRNPAWYRVCSPTRKGAVPVGRSTFVQPLRTEPRAASGGNIFLAAAGNLIGEVVESLPQGATSCLAASLLLLARRRLASFDVLAPLTPAESRAYLARATLSGRSAELVQLLETLRASVHGEYHRPGPNGDGPFCLPATEVVFQQVAVLEVLMSLGLQPSETADALNRSRNQQGLSFFGYHAWSDVSAHGLTGWRDDTAFPSDYRPDLVVVRDSDRARLLVDAKLRAAHAPGALLSASGVKDLQAYMQEYGLCRGVILVPGDASAGCRAEDVSAHGYTIRAVALPSRDIAVYRCELGKLLEDMWNVA